MLDDKSSTFSARREKRKKRFTEMSIKSAFGHFDLKKERLTIERGGVSSAASQQLRWKRSRDS
jgi:hypothetical protein